MREEENFVSPSLQRFCLLALRMLGGGWQAMLSLVIAELLVIAASVVVTRAARLVTHVRWNLHFLLLFTFISRAA